MYQMILIHPLAPSKPMPGAACNGCGVCCASQPCPLGMLASRRTTGACTALRWDRDGARYRCTLAEVSPPILAALARRWIAAGRGCDSNAQVEAV
jgi:hypothetical protein